MSTEQSAPPLARAILQYEFGPFRLDSATRSLFRGSEFIPLTPKAAETLLLLVEEAGKVVTKEQLLARVWPGVVVEEGGIANNISALRKVLDAGFDGEAPIATVARRGYRFTAAVKEGSPGGKVQSEPVVQPAAAAAPAPRTMAGAIRNTVLIADVENKTGDPVFDGTIRQALALHLAQSPHLEVLPDRKVHATLALMQKQGTPVLGEVALEICQRTGARVAITGSIFALGDDFAIGLYAVRGEDGEILFTEQARAKGKGEVLQALDQAALRLREKLGESIASVRRYSIRFDDVATSSLEALKAYSAGRDAWDTRGESAAIPQMLRAIELDPSFGSAHSALALMFGNMGQTERSAEHMQKAYDLRDRATDRERHRIVAMYQEIATGNLHAALDAYRSCFQIYPRDSSIINNCGNLNINLGHYERAEQETRHAIELEASSVICDNLVVSLLSLGRVDEASALLDEAFARGFNAFYHYHSAYQIAFLRGDGDAMQRHVDAVAGREGEEDYLVADQANTAAYFGKFSRARELWRRAAELALRSGSAEMSATWQAWEALIELEAGEPKRARAGAEAALATASGRNIEGLAGIVLAGSGDLEGAAKIAADLDRHSPQATMVQRYWLPCVRAAIAMAEHDWKKAVSVLEPAITCDVGTPQPFPNPPLCPPYLRGLAYLQGKQWEDAAREFAKITTRPALARNYVLFPLALLHGSKALAGAGRKAESDEMRAKFDAIFKDADVEIN
jgi:DNA-binding winged helix-turn-helix (wHTH) protein/tetratricopeptide (TPR) repeat protein